MKKLFLLMYMLVLVVLSGCSTIKSDKISVITTIFPLYDFVNQMKNDEIEVNMLLSPGQEVHTYDPSAKDLVNIYNCDLFIYIGGESDAWVEDILQSVDGSNLKAIKMMDHIDLLCEEDEHNHDHEHEEEYDEHIWTSIPNAISMVNVIYEELNNTVINTNEIFENKVKYISELSNLHEEFKNVVASAKRNIMVFGDRFPFLYFAHEYDLICYKAFPGCSTETEASAKTIKTLVDIVVENDLPYIYYIDLSNKNVCNAIASDAECETLLFHSCQNVTLNEFKNGTTYLSLMQNNLQTLEKGLN